MIRLFLPRCCLSHLYSVHSSGWCRCLKITRMLSFMLHSLKGNCFRAVIPGVAGLFCTSVAILSKPVFGSLIPPVLAMLLSCFTELATQWLVRFFYMEQQKTSKVIKGLLCSSFGPLARLRLDFSIALHLLWLTLSEDFPLPICMWRRASLKETH